MKDFIVLAQGGGLFYNNVFPLAKERKIWLGRSKKMCGSPLYFYVPSKTFDAEKGYANRVEWKTCYIGVPMCCWVTTVGKYVPDELKTMPPPQDYVKYDNYDAIEVPKVWYIPQDYEGVMGVPITYLDKWDPDKYELIDMKSDCCLNGKRLFKRLFIKRKK